MHLGEAEIAPSDRRRIAYPVAVARDLFVAHTSRHARLFEELRLDGDSCYRSVRLMWRLPEYPGLELTVPTMATQDTPAPVVLPLTIMRRGQMYSNFRVSGDVPVRILSHHSAGRLMRVLIESHWNEVLMVLAAASVPTTDIDQLRQIAPALLQQLVDSDIDGARTAKDQLVGRALELIASSGYELSAPEREVMHEFATNVAQRLGRRHIIWVEVHANLGDVICLEYAYETRFAPGYGSRVDPHGRLRGFYEWWKTWVAQPPSVLIVPISRHTLAHSYHVTMQAPEQHFFDRFTFVDQSLARGRELAFMTQAELAGAKVNGLEEAGGDLGHLHLYDMVELPSGSPAVLGNVVERPPGATANAAWLVSVSMATTLAVLGCWNSLFDKDAIAASTSIALALPGVAALTFSQVLDSDTRRRLSIAARLGLYMTIYATAVGVALVLLGSLGGDLRHPGFQFAYAIGVGIPQMWVLLFVWYQRGWVHGRFRRHQARIAAKYGL